MIPTNASQPWRREPWGAGEPPASQPYSQPFRALLTALISSPMDTSSLLSRSNAGQALSCRLPSAMFTPVISSPIETLPLPSQSPTQVPPGVGVGLGGHGPKLRSNGPLIPLMSSTMRLDMSITEMVFPIRLATYAVVPSLLMAMATGPLPTAIGLPL